MNPRSPRCRNRPADRFLCRLRWWVPLLLVLIFGTTGLEAWSQTVAGRVFLDLDGDGLHGEAEPGLAGVLVSDGVQIVPTQADGSFSLDLQPDPLWPEQHPRIVTLIVPDGHVPSTPWFVRLPPEQENQNLRFGIRSQTQETPFEFVHVTDVHYPRNVKAVEAFDQEMLKGAERFRFVINTGDIGNLPDRAGPTGAREQLQGALDSMKALPMPWFATPGNHELIAAHSTAFGWSHDDPGFGYGLYVELFGPLRWCFQYGGVAFVGVDIMDRLEGDAWRVGAPESVLAWLDNLLDALPPDMPVYLFGHYFHGAAWTQRTAKSNVRAVFFGHHHNNRVSLRAGVPFLEGGSLSSSNPNGYRILRVGTDGDLWHSYVEVGSPHSMIITHLAIRTGDSPVLSLAGYANGFDGTVETLEATMGDHPLPLTREPPHPLHIPFTAEADLSQFPAGFHEVRVRARQGQAEAARSQMLLNPHGENPDLADGAVLHAAVFGVDAEAELFLNGRKVGSIPPTPGGPWDAYSPQDVRTSPRIALNIPDGMLSRLNRIEIRPGTREDGTRDRIWPTYLFLEREGRIFRDLQHRGFGRFFVRQGTQWIDLETPVADLETFRERFLRETYPYEQAETP